MTDITRTRGDTYADEFEIKSQTTGLVINITGHTFLLTVDTMQAPTDSSTNLYQLVGNITDAAAGLVEFAPTAVQADVVPGRYWFDVEMTDDQGRIRTIDSGKYTYVQDITK